MILGEMVKGVSGVSSGYKASEWFTPIILDLKDIPTYKEHFSPILNKECKTQDAKSRTQILARRCLNYQEHNRMDAPASKQQHCKYTILTQTVMNSPVGKCVTIQLTEFHPKCRPGVEKMRWESSRNLQNARHR